MNKSRIGALIWVLIYGGLLTVCVSVFVLRAGAEEVLGWWMLAVGTTASAAGAALVMVRARMEDPAPAAKSPRL